MSEGYSPPFGVWLSVVVSAEPPVSVLSGALAESGMTAFGGVSVVSVVSVVVPGVFVTGA